MSYENLIEIREKMFDRELETQLTEIAEEFGSLLENLRILHDSAKEVFKRKVNALEKVGDPSDFNIEISNIINNIRKSVSELGRNTYASLLGLNLRAQNNSIKTLIDSVEG
ncbi:MAG: hypothetical protein EOM67_01570 [Spirochaetia bacterium]|nr:hypothetical protein [Spirochaetia bacterium]